MNINKQFVTILCGSTAAFASSIAFAQTYTFSLSGTSYTVQGAASASYTSTAATLQSQPWWGNSTLAYSISQAVAGNAGTTYGMAPLVAYGISGSSVSIAYWVGSTTSDCPSMCPGINSSYSYLVALGYVPSSSSTTFSSNTLAYLRSHAAGAAGMLDSLSAAPAMSGVMTALNNLSGAAQANAIAQTLPAITGAASQATTGTMQALNQIVQGRSNSLRGMASGDEYIGNRDMWMKGFGSWANQADVNGVSGYKINTGGLAIGVDQGFTPKLNIGAVLALSNSGVSSNSNTAPSGVTINSYQAGLYGDYAIEKNIIANAQADIGINQNKEYRNITFMGTNANGNYNSYSGHLGTGVKYLMPINPENTFIPSVRVDYTTVQSQAYSESGAGALNLSVAKQTYNTLIPSADVRIDHSLDSKMTLSANAGAGYNTLNNQVSATSAYAGGGTTFATNGLQVSPWLYNAGVGVTGQIDKNLQLNVRYDNVFSPTGYMNQMVSAKLKIPL
jgi:outer membrane autotransporter protein